MPDFERDDLALHLPEKEGSSGRSFTYQPCRGRNASQPAVVFSPPLSIRLLSLDFRFCAFHDVE